MHHQDTPPRSPSASPRAHQGAELASVPVLSLSGTGAPGSRPQPAEPGPQAAVTPVTRSRTSRSLVDPWLAGLEPSSVETRRGGISSRELVAECTARTLAAVGISAELQRRPSVSEPFPSAGQEPPGSPDPTEIRGGGLVTRPPQALLGQENADSGPEGALAPGTARPGRRPPRGALEPPVTRPPPPPGGTREGWSPGASPAARSPRNEAGGESEGAGPLGADLLWVPIVPKLPPGTCVMKPRLDGGTTAWIDLTADDLAKIPELLMALIRALQRDRSKDEAREDRKRGGRVARLPRRQGSLFDPESMADVYATGEWKDRLVIEVEDMMRVVLDLDRSFRKGFVGRCSVQVRARYLHSALDQRPLIGKALAEVHWWLTGDDVEHTKLGGHGGVGWTMGNEEVCADFVDLPWRREDVGHFTVKRGVMKSGDIGKVDHRTFGKDQFFAETVMLGTRASNWSVCLYNKSEQIEECKAGDSSAYDAIWDAHGLPIEQRGDVSRAELRGKGRGLVFQDEETGEIIDLRDPMVAADPEVLATLWASMTKRMRLFVPGRTRSTRCKTDPRWLAVQRAVDAEPRDLVQHREANSNAHAAAILRAARGSMRELQHAAGLKGLTIKTPEGYGAMAKLVVQQLVDENPDVLVELADNGARYLGKRMPFMGDEIRDEQRKLKQSGIVLRGVQFVRLEIPDRGGGSDGHNFVVPRQTG